MLALWIVLAALALAVAVVCLVTVYFFNFTCKRKDELYTDELILSQRIEEFPENREIFERGFKWIAEHPPEMHEITSRDGLKLKAEYIANPENRGVVMMFHGYRSSPHGDFAAVMEFFYSLGFSLFLPSHRSHQYSEGKYICFGAKERYDCVDWANYVAETFKCPILLDGISMGCTTVVASVNLGLPENVRGVIADCGFNTPGEIIEHCMRQWTKLTKFPVYYTVAAYARLKAKFGFNEFSTVDAVKEAKIPILFVHGTADDFVPPYMTDRNYEACASEKYLVKVEGATHANSYLVDREGCEEHLARFAERCIPRVN